MPYLPGNCLENGIVHYLNYLIMVVVYIYIVHNERKIN